MNRDRYYEILADPTYGRYTPTPDPMNPYSADPGDWAFLAAHMPIINRAIGMFQRAGVTWNTDELVVLLPHAWIRNPQAFREGSTVLGLKARVVFGIDDVMVALDVTK